jgi:hypothetical protein
MKTIKRGSIVVTRDTNEEGYVSYVWSSGEHADVWFDGATSSELIRVSDLEVIR